MIDFANADKELLDVSLHDKRDLDLFFAKLSSFLVLFYIHETHY